MCNNRMGLSPLQNTQRRAGRLASQLNLNARRVQGSAEEHWSSRLGRAQASQRAAVGMRARRASKLQVNDPGSVQRAPIRILNPSNPQSPPPASTERRQKRRKIVGARRPGRRRGGPACAPLRRPAARPTPSRGAEAWRSRSLRSGFVPRCRGRPQSAPAAHGKAPGQHSKDRAFELLSIRLSVGHPPSSSCPPPLAPSPHLGRRADLHHQPPSPLLCLQPPPSLICIIQYPPCLPLLISNSEKGKRPFPRGGLEPLPRGAAPLMP